MQQGEQQLSGPPQLLTAVGWVLRCTQGTSDKYYRLILAGSAVVVHYGRTGSAGAITVHRLTTPAAARAKALALTNQKNERGYELVSDPAGLRIAVHLAACAKSGTGAGDGAANVLIEMFTRFAEPEGAHP